MLEQRSSDDQSKRDIPSFIEPLPPLISNPFMRPRPQKGTNLLELFEEDSESEEQELVQVYLRLKPYHGRSNLYEVRSDRCLITSVDTATAGHGRRTQHNVSKMYTFSHIFGPECTQKEIFEHVVKDNLKKLPDGHSFTLLTYGASGSGKTYTLMGTVASPGLVPRSLDYVFRVVDAAQHPVYKPSDGGTDKLNSAEQDYEVQWVKRLRQISAPLRDKYRRMSAGLCSDLTTSTLDLSNRIRHYVWVSFVEIYNEGIYDLLGSPDRRMSSKLRIREDSNGNVYVKGATQAFVRSGEEAYDVMVAGKHNLQVAATGVHAHSSRSHCIFTITMLTESDGGVRQSCVRLCDLAGCERARMTRNTGARMQESRAINSSLHVLERCLHTLRRKQRQRNDTVVPYRESKLTRLLGAGLSGTRGEAVSMVVTLNPAPEYAHETKHVLQLAAVARDIQVNSTIAESISISESSLQDTTVCAGAEVMKLRADNERLHFELVQAHARNKELMAAMEEKQQEAADTMRELVEEAKDMTRQYYEAQIQSLRAEMDDMVEEYESRLRKECAPERKETPSRSLQKKVSQLMTEIALLEEQLTAERLARARAEEEVQHLRACIEERDEKSEEEDEETALKCDEVLSLSDSEHDSEEDIDDPCNESLEPTFKKEDINRSLRNIQILNSLNTSRTTQKDENTIENVLEENESIDTLKHDSSDETTKDSYNNDDESVNKLEETLENEKSIDTLANVTVGGDQNVNESVNKQDNPILRGTYFIRNTELTPVLKYKNDNTKTHPRSTYFVKDNASDVSSNYKEEYLEVENNNYPSDLERPIPATRNILKENTPEKPLKSLVTKIIRSVKSSQGSDSSLTQFEQLEMAANNCDETRNDGSNAFLNINVLKEKRKYFDDAPVFNGDICVREELLSSSKSKEQPNILDKHNTSYNDLIKASVIKQKKTYFDNIDANIDHNSYKKNIDPSIDLNVITDDIRSPSIVKDDVTDGFEPSTIKILLGESLTRQSDLINLVHKNKVVTKKHDSLDLFEAFESPLVTKKDNLDIVEKTKKSIEKMVLEQKSASKSQVINIREKENITIEQKGKKNNAVIHIRETESNTVEQKIKENVVNPKSIEQVPLQNMGNVDDTHENISQPRQTIYGNNTIEDFETIYKDITAPRATEFDLLLSQDIDVKTDGNVETEKKTKITFALSQNEKSLKNDENNQTDTLFRNEEQIKNDVEEAKYNLRKKSSKGAEKKWKDLEIEEVVLECQAKCESKGKPKRNLRLRRRKNQEDDKLSDQENEKLKDIVNLQKEFSDVTLDIPAPIKDVKDIPSPEKPKEEEENRPPLGVQSCPSKSVTRSRRKLFTPRIEPLDESGGPTGDSNERIYVPRPSYHRGRARRKL